MLKKLAIQARENGSKVAYVGEFDELYAFVPEFFYQSKSANGHKILMVRSFNSVEEVNGEAGGWKISVQREAYPVPSSEGPNYEVLNQAIMRATDDGAMLINVASEGAERSKLQDSIQYARSRGVAVITVPARRADR